MSAGAANVLKNNPNSIGRLFSRGSLFYDVGEGNDVIAIKNPNFLQEQSNGTFRQVIPFQQGDFEVYTYSPGYGYTKK